METWHVAVLVASLIGHALYTTFYFGRRLGELTMKLEVLWTEYLARSRDGGERVTRGR